MTSCDSLLAFLHF